MQGLDKVIWNNMYVAVSNDNKQRIVDLIKQEGMLEWEKIRLRDWCNILEIYPPSSEHCPWNKIDLRTMVDISERFGKKYEPLYKIQHLTKNHIRSVIQDDCDSDNATTIRRILKKYKFNDFSEAELMSILYKGYSDFVFSRMSDEKIKSLTKDFWKNLLRIDVVHARHVPKEMWPNIGKSVVSRLVMFGSKTTMKYIPKEALHNVAVVYWEELAKKYPAFIDELDAKKLKGPTARRFIISHPGVLAKHNMLDFGMGIDDWKRMMKATPDIIKHMPPDYEHSLVILALKKKVK